jgi:hypothetical protein
MVVVSKNKTKNKGIERGENKRETKGKQTNK